MPVLRRTLAPEHRSGVCPCVAGRSKWAVAGGRVLPRFPEKAFRPECPAWLARAARRRPIALSGHSAGVSVQSADSGESPRPLARSAALLAPLRSFSRIAPSSSPKTVISKAQEQRLKKKGLDASASPFRVKAQHCIAYWALAATALADTSALILICFGLASSRLGTCNVSTPF